MSLPVQAEIATSSTPAENQLRVLLHGAGLSRLDDLGWIRATGSDRVRWLNGMVTNSIQELATGSGNFSFVLSSQGRIQGTLYTFAEPEHLLLQTDRAQIASLTAFLDHYIIMDDVELTDITASAGSGFQAGLGVTGPHAAASLQQIGIAAPPTSSVTLQHLAWQENPVILIAAHSPLVPRYELWAEEPVIVSLAAALNAAGCEPCGHEALEWLRILEGTPRYGTDIRDRELPQETGQTRALHFAKGCYLGQEIVARLNAYDKVQRYLVGLSWEGDVIPASGTKLYVDDREVGWVTSAVQGLGLGYLKAAEAASGGTIVLRDDAGQHSVKIDERPFWAGKTRAATFSRQ